MTPFYIFLEHISGGSDFSLSDLAKSFKILAETDPQSYEALLGGGYDDLFSVTLQLTKHSKSYKKHKRKNFPTKRRFQMIKRG